MTPPEELKHSIKMHLTVMNGPTPQLAVFLIKIIDFLGDCHDHSHAIEKLSYAIVEAIALYVHQSIDTSIKRGEIKSSVSHDKLILLMAKNRDQTDLGLAKLALLKEVANRYRELAVVTNAKYPILTDCDGNIL